MADPFSQIGVAAPMAVSGAGAVKAPASPARQAVTAAVPRGGAAGQGAAPDTPAPALRATQASVMDVRARLAELEGFLRLANHNLQFSVDDQLNRVVISIVDGETGEILRMIPSEEALRIAHSLREMGSGLVDDRV